MNVRRITPVLFVREIEPILPFWVGRLGFTKAIAREAARYRVRCNAVAPGPIETPLLNAAPAILGELGERLKKAMVDSTALGRSGAPRRRPRRGNAVSLRVATGPRAGRPGVALSARRCPRRIAGDRTRIRMVRRRVARAPHRRLCDLRAAHRHVHARGHI